MKWRRGAPLSTVLSSSTWRRKSKAGSLPHASSALGYRGNIRGSRKRTAVPRTRSTSGNATVRWLHQLYGAIGDVQPLLFYFTYPDWRLRFAPPPQISTGQAEDIWEGSTRTYSSSSDANVVVDARQNLSPQAARCGADIFLRSTSGFGGITKPTSVLYTRRTATESGANTAILLRTSTGGGTRMVSGFGKRRAA